MRRALALALALGAAPAGAEMLVTNPEMCDQPDGAYLGEMGMQLHQTWMEEIEYYCEFDPPIFFDWTVERTLTRVGWCNEPGVILPTVFAFVMGPHDPGAVALWQQGDATPTTFRLCPD